MASQDWIDKDFYAVLGVSKEATDAEIKKAYRSLAKKYHPDRNAGDAAAEQKFKEISEAHDVLADPEERKEYDAIRAMGSGARFAGGADGAGFEDLFGDVFGGGRTRTRYSTGGGHNINFEDLFGGAGFGGGFGGGSYSDGYSGGFGPGGADPRFQAPPAKGEDITTSTVIPFRSAMEGTTVKLQRGNGSSTTVRIPQGVRDGQKLKLRGKGHSGPGGNGDLILTIKVGEHPVFARRGSTDDLTVTVPITFPEAALGATIKVPTVEGSPVSLKIPAGTSSGRKFRVKGKGVTTTKGTGNLIVTVEIQVPKELNDDAKAAAEAFAAATAEVDPREHVMARAHE
ncbi:DnaJ C-terminal domain-containing protein [Kocuria sp.]|uniref:DnaJ C-terminal domain-containing protein n=1 Tax=Kocuria sp. TaxID=1871328 RepID=UPI0026E10C7A|nr:DnaJ C-terminal domain-containing protein [Kocuria sp.]MDO5618603.1 DnaJ C-terminal domain-containing protein [Kocuria sp.]